MKIGIIGLGFVGGAVYNAYQHLDVQIITHDPYKQIFFLKCKPVTPIILVFNWYKQYNNIINLKLLL